MKVIPIEKLYDMNFSLDVINALQLMWRARNSFSCIGAPKRKNIIVYFHKITARYTLKDGSTFTASDGDIVYTPEGSEYSIDSFQPENESGCTVGVNFFLSDKHGMKFILSNKPIKLNADDGGQYFSLFFKMSRISEANVVCFSKLKSAMYEVFANLCSAKAKHTGSKFDMIEKGIAYMEEDPEQKLSIAEVAQMCNVSESYFRKLFKEYSSYSPTEYRINGKIEKAKQYLAFDNLTVSEVSQKLNFSDVAYFSKTFRKKCGMSPINYKEKFGR